VLLLSVPPGVVTSTMPVDAPMGTVALIAELETTVQAAVEAVAAILLL